MNRTKQKKLMAAKGVVAAIFILVIIVCIWVFVVNSGEKKINDLLNLGNKYLEDMDYESAVLVFDQVISIDPKCEEAYLGKARAQYALEQFEDAIATLQEGIAKVDDSSRLEEFLQQILEMETVVEKESGSVVINNAIERELYLNYLEIVRFTDTREPKIQLEILGDEGNEGKYTWVSSAPECVDVSSTGLVTCKSVEGTAMVYAEDEFENVSDSCIIRIYSSDAGNMRSESETVRIRASEDRKKDYAIMIAEKDGRETITLGVLHSVYYSGEVIIPEKLQFKGKDMTITGITSGAFLGSDLLRSIYLPESIEDVGIGEYETNPFYNCMNLREIRVDEDNEFLKTEDGVLYSKDGKILYSYPAGKKDRSYMLPKEVEKICYRSFLGCKNLKEILVEDGNKYFESEGGALIEKEGEKLVAYPIGNGLTSYTVPNSVRYLASDAFYSSILEEVDCSSVDWIYEDAFRQCNSLERIYGGKNTSKIRWVSDDKTVEFLGINTMENLGDLTITLSEKQDITEFSALKGLYNLSIWKMKSLNDLSWLEKMDSLRNIAISADEFKDMDLAPLYNLNDLKSITITCSSQNKKELSPDMKQQIEELKEQRPEVNISIWE